MVEQIQTTPPYDVLAAVGVTTADTKAATTNSTSSHSVTIPPKKEQDTVTLSASVQANQLYLQGNSVTQIAALLGLPPATVDNDLNINPATSTVAATIQPTTAQTAATLTPADASTPYTAASSPYTAPTTQSEQVS
jgi:hypothetical protein